MKISGRFHLTYCSNIHPGETWQEVSGSLTESLPRVRQLLEYDGPLAIGLRLSARAAETLEGGEHLAAFREFLRNGNYYVPTMNGFPYGAFHGQRVKEQVYLPDWRQEARVEYTNRLSCVLANLLSDHPGMEGSISTVPGAFRAHVASDADAGRMASGILRHAAHLVLLRQKTGTTITLALEPEPACYIETVDDALAFFSQHLFNDRDVRAAARLTGVPLTVDDVRRHVGVCFDACHMAVEFEDPAEALRRLEDGGIRIFKVQLSSALQTSRPTGPALRAALGRFAEDTYLHQVVERNAGGFLRYTDLPEALAAGDGVASAHTREWRIHFHVPIFLPVIGDFDTTQAYLATVLQLLKKGQASPHLEVETYTWDVLPPEHRATDMCTAIARELAWVRTQLES